MPRYPILINAVSLQCFRNDEESIFQSKPHGNPTPLRRVASLEDDTTGRSKACWEHYKQHPENRAYTQALGLGGEKGPLGTIAAYDLGVPQLGTIWRSAETPD